MAFVLVHFQFKMELNKAVLLVLSYIYCVYINDLLKSLAELGVGCFIGDIFVGILAYADNLVFLAPTADAMRVLLNRCDEYATEFNIVFNASKSSCLLVNCNCCKLCCFNDNPVFYINGKPIVYVNQFSHLGHIISADFNDTTYLASAICYG